LYGLLCSRDPTDTNAKMADRAPIVSPLTPRQLECLSRIAGGETSAEIGMALGLSKRTIDHYVLHACARLGVRNRTHAVVKAIGEGLITSRPAWSPHQT
jgi:LuxR family transcriptional regulator of spore coat protein